MAKTIVVLNDGETYTDITGCSILTITDEAYNALGHDIRDPGDIPAEWVLAEIKLVDSPPAY